MTAEAFFDFFCVATLLMACAIPLVLLQRNPARRVLFVRALFLGILILPLMQRIPGLPRFAWRPTETVVHPAAVGHVNILVPPDAMPVGDTAHPAREGERRQSLQRFRPMMSGAVPDSQTAQAEPVPVGAPDAEAEAASEIASASADETAVMSVSVMAATAPGETVAERSAVPDVSVSKRLSPLGMLLCVQCLAMGLVAAWQALGFRQAIRLVREAFPLAPEMLIRLEMTKPRCRVMTHPRLTSPVILGLFRPTVLLPVTSNAREMKLALAHELGHLDNGDLFALALERLVMFPLCLHPLFWFLRGRTRADQEILADLQAAEESDREEYARQLLDWARRRMRQPVFAGTSMLGITEFTGKKTSRAKQQLARRITMLLNETISRTRISRRRQAAAFFAACVLTLFFSMQTLRPQVKNLLADAPRETPEVAAVGSAVESERHDSLSLAQRWLAFFNETAIGQAVQNFDFPDEKTVRDLYDQGGFPAVKEYIDRDFSANDNSLIAAARFVCDPLFADENYAAIAEVLDALPDHLRSYPIHSILSRQTADGFNTNELTQDGIESGYETYRKIAGARGTPEEYVTLFLRQNVSTDMVSIMQSLKSPELRFAFIVQQLHDLAERVPGHMMYFSRVGGPDLQADLEKSLPLCEAFLKERDAVQDPKLRFRGTFGLLACLSATGKLTEEHAPLFEECWNYVLANDKPDAADSGVQRYADSLVEMELKADCVDPLVRRVLEIPSLSMRNGLLEKVMQYYGSCDRQQQFDLSTLSSFDGIMKHVYVDPILPVTSCYGRLLLIDQEMISQMESTRMTYCAAFADEVLKPEYLAAANAEADAFVKAESLAIIAAMNALAGNGETARSQAKEIAALIPGVSEPLRRNYLETRLARVYAFLKDGDAFGELVARLSDRLDDEALAPIKNVTLSWLQFCAWQAGEKELSDRLFRQYLDAVVDGVTIPETPPDYRNLSDEHKQYDAACNQVGTILYIAESQGDREHVIAAYEALETLKCPNRVYSYIGAVYKIDRKYAMQKMEQWVMDAAKNPQSDATDLSSFFMSAWQRIGKKNFQKLLGLYVDSLVIDTPERLRNFFQTMGIQLYSGQYLPDSWPVNEEIIRSALDAAEKMLPREEKYMSLTDIHLVSVVADLYFRIGEKDKAFEIYDGTLDYAARCFGRSVVNVEIWPTFFTWSSQVKLHLKKWNDPVKTAPLLEKLAKLTPSGLGQVQVEFAGDGSAVIQEHGNAETSPEVEESVVDRGTERDAKLKAILDAGTEASDAMIREWIGLTVDERGVVEFGEPEQEAKFITILLEHGNPENLEYLVNFLAETFAKCRAEQNGDGQLQAACNLAIVLTMIDLGGKMTDEYAAAEAELRANAPDDLVTMMQIMGCCLAKRFDLARELVGDMPEEMRAEAERFLQQMEDESEDQ